MGVLDFLRETGEKLTEMGEEAKLAERIEKRILGLGVNIKKLDVDVDDELVTLKGHAGTEEDRARAVQIAGNVWGISKVSDQLTVREEYAKPARPSKPMKSRKPVKPAQTKSESSGKMMKEPRKGGKKIRPSEPAHKKAKQAKTGRRTP